MNHLTNDPIATFEQERRNNISKYAADESWREQSLCWLHRAFEQRYMYNFNWLGRPIIQTPIDIVATQEIIWEVKPDLIIETGIAHGGSLIFSASMLAMLDYADAVAMDNAFDLRVTKRRVLGIDIDIRQHNRVAVEAHPMSHRIDMIQGSSVAGDVIDQVQEIAGRHDRILVCLDSNHTHEHVLAELEAYAPMVSKGSYCCVFDTIVDDMPEGTFPDRPWSRSSNPKTAVHEYLRRLECEGRTAADGDRLQLQIDKVFENKLLITVAPDGYLYRPT
ncbi:MAG: cephalosporin hydroxylase family protein [Betaproteobacteria bacterium]|nr:cephalosporin hydroxylase family protein [Betaproteobacteria bacterium]